MARRLMYWQAYLHKTSLVAELTLTHILQRAKELLKKEVEVPCSKPLAYFIYNDITLRNFSFEDLSIFAQLDDTDILSAIKEWQFHPDFILSSLSKMIINRDLLKIKLKNEKFPKEALQTMSTIFATQNNISLKETEYFIFRGKIKNLAYNKELEPIRILNKDKSIEEFAEASDQFNTRGLSKPVTKYYICFPKVLDEKYR